MAAPCRLAALALVLSLAACGGGGPPGQSDAGGCQHNFDCGSGQGCVGGVCQALPCGGCQPDEACADSGQCVPAQGAACPHAGCPTGYSCTGTICAKPCTLDQDCGTGFVCNTGLGKCAQCTFDNQCAGVSGKPRCDSSTGSCVACTQPIDCSHGTFCDTGSHTCKTGCLVDGDCNVATGEHCSGASGQTPGKCIQCTVATQATDCQAPTPACDSTGHCVGCVSNNDCAPNSGLTECDTTSKTCVQCLASNNATGQDCGVIPYSGATVRDPHDVKTCNAAHSCTDGCQFDTQCGCPLDVHGNETSCQRQPHITCYADSQCQKINAAATCVGTDGHTVAGTCMQNGNTVVVSAEHCDPSLTRLADGTTVSQGACAECVTGHNDQCKYRVKGSTQYNGAFAALNGGRCVNDVCVDGCDSTNDCATGLLCHLSAVPSDPLNHKCVQCSCDGQTVTDNAWCLDAADCGSQVCDTATLSCRKKRFNETCSQSTECGDTKDPALQQNGSTDCVPVPAICLKEYSSTATGSPDTFCASPGLPSGRCAIPCNDFNTNQCISGDPQANCPYNTVCRGSNDQGSGGNPGQGKYCVPASCTPH